MCCIQTVRLKKSGEERKGPESDNDVDALLCMMIRYRQGRASDDINGPRGRGNMGRIWDSC